MVHSVVLAWASISWERYTLTRKGRAVDSSREIFFQFFVEVPWVFGEVQFPRTSLFCIKVSPALSPSSGGGSEQHQLELSVHMGFVTGKPTGT